MPIYITYYVLCRDTLMYVCVCVYMQVLKVLETEVTTSLKFKLLTTVCVVSTISGRFSRGANR